MESTHIPRFLRASSKKDIISASRRNGQLGDKGTPVCSTIGQNFCTEIKVNTIFILVNSKYESSAHHSRNKYLSLHFSLFSICSRLFSFPSPAQFTSSRMSLAWRVFSTSHVDTAGILLCSASPPRTHTHTTHHTHNSHIREMKQMSNDVMR